MFQEWVSAVLKELIYSVGRGNDGPAYAWVDTNLSLQPDPTLLSTIWSLGRNRCSVCGCFKPDQVDPDTQLSIVETLVIRGISVFLYWPCDQPSRPGELPSYLSALYDIHPNLPLRVLPIHINWGYAAVQANNAGVETPSLEKSKFLVEEARDVWLNWCLARYSPAQIWSPSHLAKTW